MKRWVLAVLLVISLGINIGFLLRQAWPRFVTQKAASASGWQTDPMKRHLGLSPEQARRMEGERRKVLARVQPWQEELGRKRAELFVLLKGSEVRDADLNVILGEVARLQTAIEKEFILHSLKVRSVFDPAQLRKYEGCLERGLCPGMTTGSSCASPQPSDCASGPAGCGSRGEAEEDDKTSKPNKEVL